jgi:Protein of unknown function (DUF559)
VGAQRVACRLILLLGKELGPLNGFVVNRARSLRKRATECERILWRHLRNRNFAGYKFAGNTRLILTPSISTVRLRNSRSNWMAADITTVVGRCEIKAREVPGEQRNCGRPILGSSSSRRTRQCVASNMVCVRRENRPRSLTLILSLCERERQTSPGRTDKTSVDCDFSFRT